MSLFATFDQFGLESQEGPEFGLVPTGDGINDPEIVEQSTLELAQSKQDLEVEVEYNNELADSIQTLEAYRDLLVSSIESGGIDIHTHKAIQIGVESLTRKFGVETNLKRAYSVESMGTNSGKLTATYNAVEQLDYAIEGMFDTIKNSLKNIYQKMKKFFSNLWESVSDTIADARKLKKELSKDSTVMKSQDENIVFRGGNLLLRNNVNSTVDIIRDIMRYKKDMLDGGEYQAYWERLASIAQTQTLDTRDEDYLLRNAELKMPSYFKQGDKFGILDMGQYPGHWTPYTWAVTDNYGLAFVSPNSTKPSLTTSSLGYHSIDSIKRNEDYTAKPLTKAQAIEICDNIIIYGESFTNLSKPTFMTFDHLQSIQDGTLDEVIRMNKGQQTGNESFKGFMSDSVEEYKSIKQRFRYLYIIAFMAIGFYDSLGKNALTKKVGELYLKNPSFTSDKRNSQGVDEVFMNFLHSDNPNAKMDEAFFPITGTVFKMLGLSNWFNKLFLHGENSFKGYLGGTIRGTVVQLLLELSVFVIAMIITGYKKLKDSGKKDADLEEAYEIYESEYNKLPAAMQTHLMSPIDFAIAEKVALNGKVRETYNKMVIVTSGQVCETIENFNYHFMLFSYHDLGDILKSALSHVRESIQK